MNPNDQADELDESYNPQKYLRGDVSAVGEDRPDGCGVPDRKTKCIIITLSTGEREGFLYHAFDSFKLEPSGIVLFFRCVKDWPEPDGEVKPFQTFWKVSVTGKRLDPVVKQISELARYTLYPGGVADDDKPYVSDIVMEPVEAEPWHK